MTASNSMNTRTGKNIPSMQSDRHFLTPVIPQYSLLAPELSWFIYTFSLYFFFFGIPAPPITFSTPILPCLQYIILHFRCIDVAYLLLSAFPASKTSLMHSLYRLHFSPHRQLNSLFLNLYVFTNL